MKRKHHIKAENHSQAEAFRRMKGNKLELIARYAEDFRQIITDYEAKHEGAVPTADDLIWIESERQGRNITE